MVEEYTKKNNNMKFLLTSVKDDPKGIKSFVEGLILDYLRLYKGIKDNIDSFQLKMKKKGAGKKKRRFC